MAETVGVFEGTFLRFADSFQCCRILSDSDTYVKNHLVSGFVGLRPFADFASQMELEMELAPQDSEAFQSGIPPLTSNRAGILDPSRNHCER